MTEMMEHDDCCSKPFQRASLAGKLTGTNVWICPKCGCEWHAEVVSSAIRNWKPVAFTEIFR